MNDRHAIARAKEPDSRRQQAALSLAALGIVYGDIGTSPLYAFREALSGLEPSAENVLGILSLIFWTLMLVVSLKYQALVLRADNRGEGGILALMALINPWRGTRTHGKVALIILGIFGAALLYGDGMITPAISVLSAVEGLETTAHGIAPFVVPITVGILAALFAVQSRGTARIAALFGPITLIWFIVIAALGVAQIVEHPGVLHALNPWYAARLFGESLPTAVVLLGAVFLVATGAEALYADMGHFGRTPIRRAWFACVFPCLVLNYFGQGALVLGDPSLASQPFYFLAPEWGRYPLIALATVATVIASQAMISGAFSLTRQAVQLGQFPRVAIVQTSAEETGQIYVPAVNLALALASIGLVLGFRTSGNLASAYGLAVSATMVITTILAFYVMRKRWRWPAAIAVPITAALLVVDIAFLGANSAKVADGGWFPLLVGGLVLTLMTTWSHGRDLLRAQLAHDRLPIDVFLASFRQHPPIRVRGTAIFLTAALPRTPPMLIHHIERNQALQEQVILLTVLTEDVPRVGAHERVHVEDLGQGFHRVLIHYGFMQTPNVPVALRLAEELGLKLDGECTTYYVGRETIIPSARVPGMWLWRERLFVLLSRNALSATTYFKLPPNLVVEFGIQVEI
ncbi:MAG: potassium transport protein Kup [Proteobacteria bacterium]|nr:potassium transport protein Kup [Pseudomonadota bacterium]